MHQYGKLLLLYYCFTTALLLLYYCFTTAFSMPWPLLNRPQGVPPSHQLLPKEAGRLPMQPHRRQKLQNSENPPASTKVLVLLGQKLQNSENPPASTTKVLVLLGQKSKYWKSWRDECFPDIFWVRGPYERGAVCVCQLCVCMTWESSGCVCCACVCARGVCKSCKCINTRTHMCACTDITCGICTHTHIPKPSNSFSHLWSFRRVYFLINTWLQWKNHDVRVQLVLREFFFFLY